MVRKLPYAICLGGKQFIFTTGWNRLNIESTCQTQPGRRRLDEIGWKLSPHTLAVGGATGWNRLKNNVTYSNPLENHVVTGFNLLKRHPTSRPDIADQHVLFKIFSEMILATLAGIRAVKRNVNQPFSCLNLRIRRWDLHQTNRLVALYTKMMVRRPNSLILKGLCRVWYKVDWGRRILKSILGILVA